MKGQSRRHEAGTNPITKLAMDYYFSNLQIHALPMIAMSKKTMNLLDSKVTKVSVFLGDKRYSLLYFWKNLVPITTLH